MLSLLSLLAVVAQPPCTPQRQAITLRLNDFDSRGEVATPPAGVPAKGVAILFAGSDIADLDGAIVGVNDRIVARPMRQVADALACAGYASVRYDKRYVTGAVSADRAKFDTLTGADLAADGRTALTYVRGVDALARLPVALVGWSEGSTVAMAVAAAEPGVRAVVLMAPVVESPAATVQRHYARIGKPYLMRYAAAGALDAAAVARADAGSGGVLARIFVRMFRGFRPGETLNPLLDTNKDGRIAFAEADPIIAGWYADVPGGGLGMAATGRALPGVGEAIERTAAPVLILQGGRDAMVDPAAADRLAQRSDVARRVTLKRYPDLGHALGPATSMLEDGLSPTAARPLADMTRWLDTAIR